MGVLFNEYDSTKKALGRKMPRALCMDIMRKLYMNFIEILKISQVSQPNTQNMKVKFGFDAN